LKCKKKCFFFLTLREETVMKLFQRKEVVRIFGQAEGRIMRPEEIA
jgi:hypothetical protein